MTWRKQSQKKVKTSQRKLGLVRDICLGFRISGRNEGGWFWFIWEL